MSPGGFTVGGLSHGFGLCINPSLESHVNISYVMGVPVESKYSKTRCGSCTFKNPKGSAIICPNSIVVNCPCTCGISLMSICSNVAIPRLCLLLCKISIWPCFLRKRTKIGIIIHFFWGGMMIEIKGI